MIITTDGKTYIFGLFDADGCECENLEALFPVSRMQEIQANAVTHSRELGNLRSWKSGDCYGDPDYLSVRMPEIEGARGENQGTRR